MTVGWMIRKSLRQHALSSVISVWAVAMAGGLLMAVWIVRDQARRAFIGVEAGFDAVLGARGSKLQLVLNAVFHVDESPGTLAFADYEALAQDPNVAVAIPIAVGDSYRGVRVVGTTTNLFGAIEYRPGATHSITIPGRVFDPRRREAVVGSYAAPRLGLRLGDTFQPYHGLREDPVHRHEEEYVVVGIMEPSNTPADRAIWIPLAGIQRMGGHDPAAADQISAVLVRLRTAGVGPLLDRRYNRDGRELTFAWPIARIMAQLFDKIGWLDRVLGLMAHLVALVAAGCILTSVYGPMNERRRDIAIMRALGVHRRTVFGAVVGEGATLAAMGMAAGLVVCALILAAASTILRAQTGVALSVWTWHPILAWATAGMVGLGAIAGLVPAVKAYRTDVAQNLAPIT